MARGYGRQQRAVANDSHRLNHELLTEARRKKQNQLAIANRIVTPAKLKQINGPVTRPGAEIGPLPKSARSPKRSTRVEIRRPAAARGCGGSVVSDFRRP
jgi:hypothetical protein